AETIRHSLVSFALEPKVWPMMRSAASRMSSQTASGSLPATPIKVVLPVAHSFVSAQHSFAVEKTIGILLNLPRFAVVQQIQSDCTSSFLSQFDLTLAVLRQPVFPNALAPRDDAARFQNLHLFQHTRGVRASAARSRRRYYFDNFRGKPSDR